MAQLTVHILHTLHVAQNAFQSHASCWRTTYSAAAIETLRRGGEKGVLGGEAELSGGNGYILRRLPLSSLLRLLTDWIEKLLCDRISPSSADCGGCSRRRVCGFAFVSVS